MSIRSGPRLHPGRELPHRSFLGLEVHTADFNRQNCFDLLRQLLRGVDHGVLMGTGGALAALPKTQPT
jgi:hypothetical protein